MPRWKIYFTDINLPGRVKKIGEISDKKYLSIEYLRTDNFNIDISSGSGRKNEKENLV